jgi:predicted nucleic acid-binding protein
MSADRSLVDTNVLVYALFPAAPQHAASRALVESATDPAAGLVVFPQMLAEFFAVVTNPRRVAVAKTAEEALQAIEQFLALPGLTLLPLPPMSSPVGSGSSAPTR